MIQYDTIRLVAILGIVLLHTAANGVNQLPFGSYNWWLANVIDSACRAGVPLFLMLTGALLLNRTGESQRNFYRRRWQRLALPMLLWTFIYLAWAQLKAAWKQQPFAIDSHLLIESHLLNVISGQPYFHLWFIYLLIGLYLALPWLRSYWQRLSNRQQLTLTIGCLLLQQSLLLARFFHQSLPSMPDWFIDADQLPWPLWFVAYLPYVLLGAVLRPLPPAQALPKLPAPIEALYEIPAQTRSQALTQALTQVLAQVLPQALPQSQHHQPARLHSAWCQPLWQRHLLLAGLVLAILTTALGYAWQRSSGNPEPFFYSYHRLSLPVLCSALALWLLLIRWHITSLPPLAKQLMAHSFGIYLVHPLWLDVSSALLQQPWLAPAPYALKLSAQWLFIVAASLGCCLAWQWAVRGFNNKSPAP